MPCVLRSFFPPKSHGGPRKLPGITIRCRYYRALHQRLLPTHSSEYRQIKRPFPRTARAHSVVPPALPDASPTPRRAADAPTRGARQRETGLHENCRARDGFTRAYSEKQARSATDATLWHSGGAAETGTNNGTASIVVARAAFKRVRACRTRPRQGMRHTGNNRTRWGDADAGRPGLPTHRPREGGPQAQGQARPERCGPTSRNDWGRSRSLPGAVRRRTRRRLPGGHVLGQWKVGPRRAAPQSPVPGRHSPPQAAPLNNG